MSTDCSKYEIYERMLLRQNAKTRGELRHKAIQRWQIRKRDKPKRGEVEYEPANERKIPLDSVNRFSQGMRSSQEAAELSELHDVAVSSEYFSNGHQRLALQVNPELGRLGPLKVRHATKQINCGKQPPPFRLA